MSAVSCADRVAVLVLPGVLALEFGIAVQIFGADPLYSLTVCAPGRQRRSRGEGFSLTAAAGLEALEQADTLIVPGVADVDAPVPDGVLGALAGAHARGVRVVSICSAAFLFGAAGLLDGREATTHWQLTDKLQRRFPRATVRPNRLFVEDDGVLSSAGVTAGIDLCLHLIRADHGPAAANRRARALVAPPQRLGGQAQYAEPLANEPRGERLAELREWMIAHLAEPLNVDTLAAQANVSRRTLIRHFRADTGAAPIAWLTDARLDLARELLERGEEPIEQLGAATGLGSPAAVRALFHRRLGISPQEYRARFRLAGASD